MNPLNIQGRWFVDSQKRKWLLRGVNLGGSSKIPYRPNGATHLPTDYRDHRTVSFIGRPFPLAEAGEHYRRLRTWGFNCVRFLTTWEAIEHAGPGQYDEDYLDYLYEVVKKAQEYGLYVFIDPHQDVWSRMSGGDGAPGWTLEIAGFDLAKLDGSEAAVTMAGRFPQYGKMIWPTNSVRLASATMFTLFFAGERFAPHLRVDGENIQSFLQRHFIQSMQRVANRLTGLPHVLGYDSLNEPSAGYIGIDDLSATIPTWVNGPLLTYFEGMFVPAGYPHEVPWIEYEGLQPGQTGMVVLNPQCVSAWADPSKDVWRQHGVWDVDQHNQPTLLRPDYFSGVRFFTDCVRPFINQYASAIRTEHPEAMFFIEGEPGSYEPMRMDDHLPVVNASHWYDVLTLNNKVYNPDVALEWGTFRIVRGIEEVRKQYAGQIGQIVSMSEDHLNGAPTLIGEFGLPFDLEEGTAYRTKEFSVHVQALGYYYDALDANLVHSTLWNYTADNDNRWGDQWNQEDLSIFSRDQQSDPDDIHSGGRAVTGFSRPFVEACAGTPLRQMFDPSAACFELDIEAGPGRIGPTVVFVPLVQFPSGFDVRVTAGTTRYNIEQQKLEWEHPTSGRMSLVLQRKEIS